MNEQNCSQADVKHAERLADAVLGSPSAIRARWFDRGYEAGIEAAAKNCDDGFARHGSCSVNIGLIAEEIRAMKEQPMNTTPPAGHEIAVVGGCRCGVGCIEPLDSVDSGSTFRCLKCGDPIVFDVGSPKSRDDMRAAVRAAAIRECLDVIQFNSCGCNPAILKLLDGPIQKTYIDGLTAPPVADIERAARVKALKEAQEIILDTNDCGDTYHALKKLIEAEAGQ